MVPTGSSTHWNNSAVMCGQIWKQNPRRFAPPAMKMPGNILLIIDNLDLEPLFPDACEGETLASLPCQTLFTTWHPIPPEFVSVEVKLLSEEAALKLLLPESDPRRATEEEEARAVCALLGYHARAIATAAAYLRKRPDVSVAAYRKKLEERGVLTVLAEVERSSSAEAPDARYKKGAFAAFAEQWDILKPEAQRLLQVAGQLPEPAHFPLARLGLLAGLSDQEEGELPPPLLRAVDNLHDMSLLEKTRVKREPWVRLHTLVHDFAKSQTSAEETLPFRRFCLDNMVKAYEDFAVLERQCDSRGVTAPQEDLDYAATLLSGLPEPQSID